jgi:hypothetical protein
MSGLHVTLSVWIAPDGTSAFPSNISFLYGDSGQMGSLSGLVNGSNHFTVQWLGANVLEPYLGIMFYVVGGDPWSGWIYLDDISVAP